MANAKAKTINLLLHEGDLEGVISIEDSSWNSGEMYSAPRQSVGELLNTDACKKYGIYLLLSKSTVYIGQSSDLAKRITQHTVGKDWWESVVILTTKDDSLTHSDIDYLESVLIEKAFSINKLDCDNKNKGNNPKVSKFQKVFLDQYLEEALFLMQLIGITVFCEKTTTGTLINTVEVKTKLAVGKRAKQEAISYLKEKGIEVGKTVTYAVKQDGKELFWANPSIDVLHKEWWLILNNNVTMELFVLKVPENSMGLKTKKSNGLSVRKDKPVLHLYLDTKTLHDQTSDIDFSSFVVKRIKY